MKTLTTRLAVGAASIIALGAVLAGATGAQATTTTPAPSPPAVHACKGRAASLTASQCASFRSERRALRAQRAAILQSYGISVPTTGRLDRASVRHQIKELVPAQRKALRTQLRAWRAERAALFTKYGISVPTHY